MNGLHPFGGDDTNPNPIDGDLLNFMQSTSSGGGGSYINDFPALAGRVEGLSLRGDGEAAAVAAAEAAFTMQNEDFPALSSFGKAAAGTNEGNPSSTGSASSLASSSQFSSSTFSGFRITHPGALEEENVKRFGLVGLLQVVRMKNKDLNMLSLGLDLMTMGMNLNQTESVATSFASPWKEGPAPKDVPAFNLPHCFQTQPQPLKTTNMQAFQLETLFYIFYTMPKDMLQAYAAQELYSRDWKYHVELKLWFQRKAANSTTTASTSEKSLSAQYVYFDINTWEKRLFSGGIQSLHSGLLPEDQVRSIASSAVPATTNTAAAASSSSVTS